jgi:Fe/S biogenesis protein NfuA
MAMADRVSGNVPANGQTHVEQPVVHFTEAARKKIVELLESKGYLGTGALRVSVKSPGFGSPEYGMALEESGEPRAGDTVIQADGFRVLVDAESLPLVNGASVDFFDQVLQRGFKVEAPPPPPAALPAERPELDMSDPVVATVRAVIDQQVNPSIASHGGRASLIDVKDNVVYVELGGGCQGCSMASVTLKQGVEQLIKQAVPQVREIVDTTDHAGGTNPYYTAAKGGASPFAQSAKG